MKTGFWNIRSLREPGKLKQVAKEMERYKLNILGLYVIRWKEFGTLTLQNGLTLLYSGVPTGCTHTSGVGILLAKTA
jgi:hypothetical protein